MVMPVTYGLHPSYPLVHSHLEPLTVGPRNGTMFTKPDNKEIDKLLKVGFIRPVKGGTWLSPIVVVAKKNGKIRVCVDYRKLNVVTVTDAFSLPFTDRVPDVVVGHKIYSFLDRFSGYNQIRMHPDGQEKTVFITD